MISVNAEAMKVVREVLADAEAMGVIVHRLDNGSTLIDMGLEAPGGWRAARAYTLITLGGLAEVSYEPFPMPDRGLPGVRVMIDHPIQACVASQIAGWRQEAPGTEHAAILAGPGRALNHGALDRYFDLIDYRDHHDEAVVALQTSEPVSAEMAERIAQGAGVASDRLVILMAPNRSLVCAVQVAARIVEQSLHRLAEEGFDLRKVCAGQGFGVIPPLIDDDLISMGRINDSLLYGGVATLYVRGEDEQLAEVVPRAVSAASRAYGRPFAEIYEDFGRDFYEIPADLHSPAVLHVNNLVTGRTFRAGELNLSVLEQSFFG